MRLTQLFAPTLKELPREAEVVSHQLLLRAGYIRKLAAGIYNLLPLGWRTVRKIEEIVRQEMDRSGAQELLMPIVQPAEIWRESGRWQFYGPELLRIRDRKNGEFCLGPTHEEVITSIVRGEVRSYRQLPVNLYQIQAKFRDEVRPRAGLMRGREFIMKDGYSFDADEEGAKKTYRTMYDAYVRIFERCGLAFRPVEADTGNIGGNMSHEFQVLTETGEDSIVSCPSCGYTANVEQAEIRVDAGAFPASCGPMRTVPTPGARTIEEVAAFLGVPARSIVKTLIVLADDKPVAVLIRGDLEINEVKVRKALGCATLHMAGDAVVQEATGSPVGFAGPVGLAIPVLADRSVEGAVGVVCGANEADMHRVDVDLARDAGEIRFADLRLAGGGDACGRCGGTFAFFRGIEVGQVFYLGTKYSSAMGATFLNEKGEERPFIMGCYGIGITRIMSAAIEQNHDADGILWPMALAPFHVIVTPLQTQDERVMATAEQVYRELGAQGIDVLLDDRDQRPGVKFKDADLIGIPIRITVSQRGLEAGRLEVKARRVREAESIALEDVVREVAARVRAELGGGAA